MRTVTATRYVMPLREGGSLPAIVEASDEGMYVVKLHGAGQGVRALVAECVSGELARAAGLPVPELVKVQLPSALSRNEPDAELRALLKKSAGLNVGLDYLPRSLTFDPIVGPAPSAELASAVVWFDAFILNVDRTPKNPNLLVWHRALHLIDHGASLYFHHGPEPWTSAATSPFKQVRQHVLLPWATELQAADERMRARLSAEAIASVLAQVPDVWLAEDGQDPAARRASYQAFFEQRRQSSAVFLEEAIRARAELV